jgi:hypothetical protein
MRHDPAGPKPASGVPPVPEGLRVPRTHWARHGRPQVPMMPGICPKCWNRRIASPTGNWCGHCGWETAQGAA